MLKILLPKTLQILATQLTTPFLNRFIVENEAELAKPASKFFRNASLPAKDF